MKTVYCYDLHVNGIFGRKRKPQREMFTVVKYSEAKLDHAEAIKLAQAELDRIKLKGRFSLHERVGTIENDGGIEIYSTKLIFGQAPIWAGLQA